MVQVWSIALCCMLLITAPPARGADDRVCLSPREMRARIQSDELVRPGSVRDAASGDIVALELCLINQKFVYVVTVLAPDGAVQRQMFDARSGRRIRP